MKLEPLAASLVHSVAAATTQASVATVTSASPSMTADVRLGMSTAPVYTPPFAQGSPSQTATAPLPAYERGVRYFSLTESGEKPTPDIQSPPPAEPLGQSSCSKAGASQISSSGQKQEESGRRGRLGYLGREERESEPIPPQHTHVLRRTPPHDGGKTELRDPQEREKQTTPISQGSYLSPDTHQTARGTNTRTVGSGKQ